MMVDKFVWQQPCCCNDCKPMLAAVPEMRLIEVAVDWCEFVGYDSKDEKIVTAFIMGAKLALSNNGWSAGNGG